MGQGFSNDVLCSDRIDGHKSIMIFISNGIQLDPVPAVYYFRDPFKFIDKNMIIVEPTNSTDPIRLADYKYPKVSYKEIVRNLNQKYKITPMKIDEFNVWYFSPNISVSDDKPKVMQLIKQTNFSYFSSKVDISCDSIFSEGVLPQSFGDAIKRAPLISRRSEGLLLPINVKPANQGKLSTTKSLDSKSIMLHLSNFSNSMNTKQTSDSVYPSDTLDHIDDHLYISGENAASNLSVLRDKGITHIVNLNAGSSPINFPEIFAYFSLRLRDSVFEVLDDEFWDAVNFTNKAIEEGGTVLVHCRKGISRSAALCLAYFMEYRNMSFDDAMAVLKEARPIISINNGFSQQIIQHISKRQSKNSD